MSGEDIAYWSLVVDASGLVLGLGAAGFVVYQIKQAATGLKKTAEANIISGKALLESARANSFAALGAVLSLEQSLAQARYELAQAAADAALAASDKGAGSNEATIRKLALEERKEQYLNFADRLCACIIRGYVDEEQYRQDYRPTMAEIVQQHSEKFGANTRHRNIRTVHEAWSQDRPARQLPTHGSELVKR